MNLEEETPRERARRLRTESTAEELRLWTQLRGKRFAGFKFRRQHRIGPYFADFCCIARHLVIELDGSQHAEEEKERTDSLRTAYLEEQGYRVMRFWNNQINTELEGVLQAIYAALTDS
ncbi:MAG TPA: endonuclease domain-containing protein [Candidatus Binataceae bacterium]|jgi:very-short-patch-repair endonuclease